MKILATENYTNVGRLFKLNIVSRLDATFEAIFKPGFFNSTSNFKKVVFTNGKVVKQDKQQKNGYCIIKYNIKDGDWLVTVDYSGTVVLYIVTEYCGPIKILDKILSDFVEVCYRECKNKIEQKKNFAKDMGNIARSINIPFEVVISFKGDVQKIQTFMEEVYKAINDCYYLNGDVMKKLKSYSFLVRADTLKYIGVSDVPPYSSERLANYMYNCLLNRKIITNRNK